MVSRSVPGDHAERHACDLTRRSLLVGAVGLLPWSGTVRAAVPAFAPVIPGRALRFPEDEGSHPDFRTEWWYVTGWLDRDVRPLGFQITFFRTRPHPDTGNPSRFHARDVLIAHAAVSDQAFGRLRDEQRIARVGFDLVRAQTGETDVRIDHWRLHAAGNGYRSRIDAKDFALDLAFERRQPPLLHGDGGYSRKGPNPLCASYYYSLPHLQVDGRIRLGPAWRTVRGAAWLDHEWSSEAMDSEAVGWDWAGINLDDGSALMAFRMRSKDGTALWAGGTLARRGGQRRARFGPGRRAVHADAPVAFAAHGRRIPGGIWRRGRRPGPGARPVVRRSGTRLARVRRHRVLGGCGTRAPRRPRRRTRLSRVDRYGGPLKL